jgi:hypothetical protein
VEGSDGRLVVTVVRFESVRVVARAGVANAAFFVPRDANRTFVVFRFAPSFVRVPLLRGLVGLQLQVDPIELPAAVEEAGLPDTLIAVRDRIRTAAEQDPLGIWDATRVATAQDALLARFGG